MSKAEDPSFGQRLADRLRDATRSALDVPPELPAEIMRNVALLREQAGPNADPAEIAWRRIRERARRTATIGAVTTLPAMVPGVGTALAALGLVADWRYVAEQQRDMVLEIAALFGVLPENPTEDVLALFLAGAGAAFGGKKVGEAAIKTIAEQVAKRSLRRVIPGAGAIMAGAVNYAATFAIGRASIQRFAEEAGVQVRGIVPRSEHTAMPRLREAVMQAATTGGSLDATFDADLHTALAELGRPDREELLDLALASARDLRSPILPELAPILGFTPAELAQAVSEAERDRQSVKARAGELFEAAVQRTPLRRIWRK